MECYSALKKTHLKKCIWVSSNEVYELRAYYTEWSKSQRERQILYKNACVWNRERWFSWSYLQGSNGDADVENRLVDIAGRRGGMNWEGSMETHALLHVKQRAKGACAWHRDLNPLLRDGLEGDGVGRGREAQMAGTHVHLWPWDGVGRRGQGGSDGGDILYTCGWLMLMHGRNQHSIVKQLSSNKKLKMIKIN